MTDKVLAYTAPDGTEQAMIPNWGHRLVKSVTLKFNPNARYEDIQRALRTLGNALNGAVAVDYAETEEKFVNRLAKKALPAKAKNQRILTAEQWKSERAVRDSAPTA